MDSKLDNNYNFSNIVWEVMKKVEYLFGYHKKFVCIVEIILCDLTLFNFSNETMFWPWFIQIVLHCLYKQWSEKTRGVVFTPHTEKIKWKKRWVLRRNKNVHKFITKFSIRITDKITKNFCRLKFFWIHEFY